MGAEAYGLVGFFTMLQAWFGLLDMGLTPTISRETARYQGGLMTALAYRQLFRSLSLIFIGVALFGGGGVWFFADSIAVKWLDVEELNIFEVVIAVQIMSINVALRWIGGLYRGVITGSERLVWLSSFNAFNATLRFIAVFISMWLYGFTPLVFFIHQLVVALIEVLGLYLMASRLLPTKGILGAPIGWSFKPVKRVLKFSLSITLTSSIWVCVTQTDKLVLSGILPLAEYGFFTLAVLVANVVMVISGPISSAIMPRMARLHAEGKHEQLIKVYRNATQMISVIAGSAAVAIAFCAEPLLYAWTGDPELAKQVAPILRLYAIGNGFLAVAAFPYYLQYALGNLRYHLIGNALMVVGLIPGIVLATTYYGGVGAGYVWVGLTGTLLLVWVAYVHHKLVPGLHYDWFFKDIMMIILPVVLALGVISLIDCNVATRLAALVYVVGLGSVALLLGFLASPCARGILKSEATSLK